MTDRLSQFKKEMEKHESKLLSDTSQLNDKEKQLLDYSTNKEWANPKFKLRWFVGETQITPFSKIRQYLLELKSREEAIGKLEYDIDKYQIQIERHEHLAEITSDEFDKREHILEAKELNRTQVLTRRRLVNWYMERQQVIDLITEFLDSEEALLPDGSGRTYMDIMDTDEEDDYEAEYWTNRLAKQAATDLLFYGRIGTGNMDAILSMAPKQQTETLALAMNFGTQLQQIQSNIQSDIDQKLAVSGNTKTGFLTKPPVDNLIEKQKNDLESKKTDEGNILGVYNPSDNS
jgi:hypothetical protein